MMYEYKVLSQKDKWFSGKFNPETLEQAINSYAKQGWRVKCISTAEISSGIGNREEMVIILERKLSSEYDEDNLDLIKLPKL